MKKKLSGSKAKSAVMQPKYRPRTEPAEKGGKSYTRKPKHSKRTGQQEED